MSEDTSLISMFISRNLHINYELHDNTSWILELTTFLKKHWLSPLEIQLACLKHEKKSFFETWLNQQKHRNNGKLENKTFNWVNRLFGLNWLCCFLRVFKSFYVAHEVSDEAICKNNSFQQETS